MSRPARAAAVAVAALLVAVAWVTPQVPSAAARATPRCGAYKGKRLLRSRSLAVIVRTQEQQREYAFICVPPGGRVHLAGWAFDETRVGTYSVKVLGRAGSWAAIQFESTVDFHGGEVVDKMCNAHNGRWYYFFHRFRYGMPELEEGVTQSELEGVVVNSFGQMLLAETGKGATRVIGVGFRRIEEHPGQLSGGDDPTVIAKARGARSVLDRRRCREAGESVVAGACVPRGAPHACTAT